MDQIVNDAIVLERSLDKEWWFRMHVMAGKAVELEPYQAQVPAWGTVQVQADELQLLHLRAAWPVREGIRVTMPQGLWPVAAWWIGDLKVSQAILDAAVAYALAAGRDPEYAFIREIPARAEEFVDVHKITLVRAAWVPEGFVAVTSGGMQPTPKYTIVQRQSEQAQERLL